MERKLLRLGTKKPASSLSNESAALIRRSVYADIDSVYEVFREKQEIAVENADFYFGNQWTDAQRAQIEQQDRKPYVFNEILDKVEHLKGTQMQTRLDVKILPRERADAPAADILNFIIKWAEQINNLEFIESAIFTDMLITGIGVATVRWDMSDMVSGYPCIERVPFNQVFWDGDSKEIDGSDAKWQCIIKQMRRKELKELLPEFASIINKAPAGSSNSVGRFATPVQTTREKKLSMSSEEDLQNHDRGLVEYIEHYELRQVEKFIVVDEIKGVENEFDDLKDAEALFEGLVDEYSISELPEHDLLNPDGTDRISLQSINVYNAWQTIIIGNEVVSHIQTPLTFLPYVIFYCNFFDGEYTGFVERLKDAQTLINRNFSQLDYAIGASAKQLITIIPSMLQDKTKAGIANTLNNITKQSANLIVQSHEAIRLHGNQPVNPELFANIQFGLSATERYAGGKNTLGRTESAAESGRAVIARAEAGGISKIPIFDNLRLGRKTLTEHLMWYIKNYMTAAQIVNVIGLDESLQYVDIDDGVMDSIREMRGDVTVDEAVKSESVRSRQFEQLIQFAQIAGIPGEKILPAVLDLSELSESSKEKVEAAIETYNQYEQQKNQMEMLAKEKQQVESQFRKEQLSEQLKHSQGVQQQMEEEKKLRDTNVELTKLQKAKAEAEQARTLEDKVNATDNLPPAQARQVSMQASLT